MPFLMIQKKGATWPSVDEAELAKRLCPYRGSIVCHEVGSIRLYLSSLGETKKTSNDFQAQIPKAGSFVPGTAWARIQIQSDAGLSPQIETDPMGAFPVWEVQSEQWQAWASEAKSFPAILGFKVQFRSDNEVLRTERRDRQYSPYTNVSRYAARGNEALFQVTERVSDPTEASDLLRDALLSSSQHIHADSRTHSFLSGGIDSSVATALLKRKYQKPFTVFTLGTPLGNEYAESKELSDDLGLKHQKIELQQEQISDLWNRVVFANEVFDGMSAEILLQTLRLSEAASATSSRIVTGYGSDLIFGGMLRHKAYLEAVGVNDTPGLIERTRWSMELAPFFAWSLGLDFFHLYWSPVVIRAALDIQAALHYDASRSIEKVLLRQTAVTSGWVQQKHAYRPKLGMTNGTRVNEMVSRFLGMSDVYGYATKTADAWQRIKQVIEKGRVLS